MKNAEYRRNIEYVIRSGFIMEKRTLADFELDKERPINAMFSWSLTLYVLSNAFFALLVHIHGL